MLPRNEVLETFHPEIDRFDCRRAALLFSALWPDHGAAKSVAGILARSIRAAHAVGGASWEVTMHARGLRLNVGQVEVLTFAADGARFLFSAPLEPLPDKHFEITQSSDPVYRAVPVPSGICGVQPSDLGKLPDAVRGAHESYIRIAASLKRHSPFRRSHSPAVVEWAEVILGEALPRPAYTEDESLAVRVEPLPDELDISAPLVEGARYQLVVNAYERDPRARRICLTRYGTACVICGFSFGARYGPMAEGLIHVHHLRPLSEIGEQYEVNPLEDLRPVCPNCHMVLHRRTPPYSIEEVQRLLRDSKSRQ